MDSIFDTCLRFVYVLPVLVLPLQKVSTLREVSGNWQELQRQRAMAEADLDSSVNVRKKFCNFGAAQIWSAHINIPYKLPHISPQPATFPAGNPRPHRCQHSTCWSKVCWQGCKFQLFYLASSSFYLWCLHPVLSCFSMFFHVFSCQSNDLWDRVGCWVVGSLGQFGGFALDEAGRPQEFLRDSRGTLARGECLGDPWPSCVTITNMFVWFLYIFNVFYVLQGRSSFRRVQSPQTKCEFYFMHASWVSNTLSKDLCADLCHNFRTLNISLSKKHKQDT